MDVCCGGVEGAKPKGNDAEWTSAVVRERTSDNMRQL